MEFVCDLKYENVIEELVRRGWFLSSEDSNRNTSQIQLIWKNLTKIKFQQVWNRFVNHFKGSSHLSNKAILSFSFFLYLFFLLLFHNLNLVILCLSCQLW